MNPSPKKALTRKIHWKPRFLAALADTGVVREAAAAARIDVSTAYAHRDKDEQFAADWQAALDQAADLLEKEAWRRAAEGLRRKKFTKDGDPVIDPETGEQYFEREYSDTLLIFLLKGMRPQKYRENRHITGDGTAAPTTVIFNVPEIPTD